METDKTLDAIDQFESHFSKEEQQGLIDRITKANRDFDKRVSEDIKNYIIESVRKIPNKGIKPDEYFRQIGRVTYTNMKYGVMTMAIKIGYQARVNRSQVTSLTAIQPNYYKTSVNGNKRF